MSPLNPVSSEKLDAWGLGDSNYGTGFLGLGKYMIIRYLDPKA